MTGSVVTGVLTTSYPRFEGDAAGSFVAERVRALARAGQTVDVLCAAPHPTLSPLLGGKGEGHGFHSGVAVHPIPPALACDPGGLLFYGGGAPEALEHGGLRAWVQAFTFTSCLWRATARFAPRWRRIESHWLLPCGVVAAAAAPWLPHRAHAHSGDVALLERLPLGGALARWLAATGAELVFASADLKGRFGRLAGRSTGQVAPMTVDGLLFSPAPAELRAALRRARGLERPTVLSVGRLVPIKGHDVLVQAMAALAAEATLVIVGEGPEGGRLAERARAAGVDLRLPGAVPHTEAASWMRAADIYVQPSRSLSNGRTEGMPVAVLEALAVGLPVIAAATGGLPELPGLTALVAPGDPTVLAHRLAESLAACSGLRTGTPVTRAKSDAAKLA